MLAPFVHLLANIISLINLALFVWIIMGLLMQFDIINQHNQIVQRVYFTLSKLFEPILAPIRRFLGRILPDLGGIDLSPIVLILLLMFLKDILYSWFL
jgi:YggT family protein